MEVIEIPGVKILIAKAPDLAWRRLQRLRENIKIVL